MKRWLAKAGRIVTAKNGWGDEMPNELKYEKTVDAEDGNSFGAHHRQCYPEICGKISGQCGKGNRLYQPRRRYCDEC